jgi:hypothetical protein
MSASTDVAAAADAVRGTWCDPKPFWWVPGSWRENYAGFILLPFAEFMYGLLRGEININSSAAHAFHVVVLISALLGAPVLFGAFTRGVGFALVVCIELCVLFIKLIVDVAPKLPAWIIRAFAVPALLFADAVDAAMALAERVTN